MSSVWVDDLSGETVLEVHSPKYGGFIAKIPADRAQDVAAHTWHVHMTPRERIYFTTHTTRADGKQTGLQLHRLLTGCPDGIEVDHENHDYLDLTELRCVTKAQNQQNQRKQARSTSSRFKGVTWHKHNGLWMAQIQHGGEKIRLGYFPATPAGEIEAALAYDRKALELFTHPKLNFPTETLRRL